jgi:hypothetical protein
MPNETDQRTSGVAGALQGSGNAFSSIFQTRFSGYADKKWYWFKSPVSASSNKFSTFEASCRPLLVEDIVPKGLQDLFKDNDVILDFYRKQFDSVHHRKAASNMESGVVTADATAQNEYQVVVAKQRLDAIRAEAQRAEEDYEAALSNARKEDTHASLVQLTAQQQRDTGKTAVQRYAAFKAQQREGK